ncbi:MAG: hypothetical protein AB1668_01045 [Nanoarchaeota archaeon]
MKVQPDSPLLKGIKGKVETSDGLYVAVDAKAVSEAVKGDMRYFPIRNSENVIVGNTSHNIFYTHNTLFIFKHFGNLIQNYAAGAS